MKLIIVRGLPGSGKSSLAKTLAADSSYQVFEADQFFMIGSQYKFDKNGLKRAHKDCLDRTRKWLEKGNNAIVSNTFTTLWELRPYFDLAESLGITPQVIECQNNYGSIHEIPSESYKRMRERFDHDISESIPITNQSIKNYVESNLQLVKRKEQKDGLYILKYKSKVFYKGLWNPYLELCRGAVVDQDYNPVSMPMIKIYNYGIEAEAPELLDTEMVTAFRKVNGFMICATWHNGEVLLSTTGSIISDFVQYAWDVIENQGIKDSLSNICESNPDKTYIFECVSPKDPHIIPEKPGLYLLALRRKNWNSRPTAYPSELNSISRSLGLEPVESYITTMKDLLDRNKTVKHEGFVFYTKNGLSSKLKSPYYLIKKWFARVKDLDQVTSEEFKKKTEEEFYPLIEAVRENKESFSALSEQDRLNWIRNFLSK